VNVDPVLNLFAEDCLDKVEHDVDKGGQVDVVDPLVPHGNAVLAQVDHSPQLNRVPEGHVSKRKVASVNYAREASNLVLVVFQKSFQSNSNDFDHVLHGVARGVQKSRNMEYHPSTRRIALWQYKHEARQHQLLQSWIEYVQVPKVARIVFSHHEVFFQYCTALLYPELLHPEEAKEEVVICSTVLNVRL